MHFIAATLVTLSPLLASALQSWQVPDMHIQGPGPTGIPGGGTAPANVTISFTFQDPNTSTSTTCGATYLPANYPTSYIPCADSNFGFKFETPYSFGQFTLDLRHSTNATELSTSYGGIYVTSNDYISPNGYLTCVGGAPFDGIRCTIMTNKTPMTVPIASTLTFQPFQIGTMSNYAPAGRPGQDPRTSINFTVSDTNPMSQEIADCSLLWQPSSSSNTSDWIACSSSAISFRIPSAEFHGIGDFTVDIKHTYTSTYQ